MPGLAARGPPAGSLLRGCPGGSDRIKQPGKPGLNHKGAKHRMTFTRRKKRHSPRRSSSNKGCYQDRTHQVSTPPPCSPGASRKHRRGAPPWDSVRAPGCSCPACCLLTGLSGGTKQTSWCAGRGGHSSGVSSTLVKAYSAPHRPWHWAMTRPLSDPAPQGQQGHCSLQPLFLSGPHAPPWIKSTLATNHSDAAGGARGTRNEPPGLCAQISSPQGNPKAVKKHPGPTDSAGEQLPSPEKPVLGAALVPSTTRPGRLLAEICSDPPERCLLRLGAPSLWTRQQLRWVSVPPERSGVAAQAGTPEPGQKVDPGWAQERTRSTEEA